MKNFLRLPLFALALAAALPAIAQRPPISPTPPRTSGLDVDTAAEDAIARDAAADAARTTAPVAETTDEAEAPVAPARIGQVTVEDVETAAPAADAALDSDGDGVPDDQESPPEREEQ